MESTSANTATCANCGALLTGPFCARCGERALDAHALTVRHFLTHTVAHEVLHVDGKIWRTLRSLLFRPGFLSVEYCAGRRTAYVNPVRLLITSIILYAVFLTSGTRITLTVSGVPLSIAPARITEGSSIESTVERLDRFGILQRQYDAKRAKTNLESESAQQRFHRKLETFGEPLSFANVLLLALALYVVFHRRRPLLVEHGIFSIHVLCFVLISSAVGIPLVRASYRVRSLILPVIFAIILWQWFYVVLAIRRFYVRQGEGRIRRSLVAIVSAAFVYVLNSAFITAVQIAGAALAFWTM